MCFSSARISPSTIDLSFASVCLSTFGFPTIFSIIWDATVRLVRPVGGGGGVGDTIVDVNR